MGTNVSVINLPAQSGKTKKMTDLINRWKQIISEDGIANNCLNVIFTSNNKLLTKQTAGRIQSDVDDVDDLYDNSSDDNISDITNTDISDNISDETEEQNYADDDNESELSVEPYV